MEAGVLRKLHAHLDLIDPEMAEDLYADSLLTKREKEKIDAETVPTKKASLILSSLRRRKPKKALRGLIKFWEKDKEENEEILTILSEAYPSYRSGSDQEASATDGDTDVAATRIQSSHLVRSPLGASREKSLGSPENKIVPITRVKKLRVKPPLHRNQYQMGSSPRGYCVIINNVHFKDMKPREGSNWDANALETLFGDYLDFRTQRFEDRTSQDMLAVLHNLQKQDHSQLDCLVVAVLSHGLNGQIYGSDDKVLSVKEIVGHFCGTRCPSLAGKPKVFILQACRGDSFDHGVVVEGTDSAGGPGEVNEDAILDQDETDGGGYDQALPDEADFILAYATTPGYVSWRNSGFGTWFIKAFTETMRNLAATDHLMDILTEVNRKVAEEYESRGKHKQMPAPVSMLRYKLFLAPHSAK